MRQPDSGYRDVTGIEAAGRSVPNGRTYVSVIGIDRYRAWTRLHNAVRDARGALDAFVKLGFEPLGSPLLNEAATCSALQRLVTDDLRRLGKNDSLVLFFAGHGHTVPPAFADAVDRKAPRLGYLIPSDGDGPEGSIGTWIKLESWLKSVAELPPWHILVILDACHSGIALDPTTHWRGQAAWPAQPMASLRARRSRRVITSALDDEVAMDGGPIAGHSLFTGCLIEALGGELFATLQRPVAAASELWTHVRRRVFSFSSQKNWTQTPAFGRLDHDDHGELVIELPQDLPAWGPGPDQRDDEVVPGARERKQPGRTSTRPSRKPRERRRERQAGAIATANEPECAATKTRQHTPSVEVRIRHAEPEARRTHEPGNTTAPPSPTRPAPDTGPGLPPARLEPAFVTLLDRHDAERARGASVLSVVAGEPAVALTGWAGWAARRGRLTLVTESAALEATIADLLSQAPWLRCLGAARTRLAVAADLPPGEVDAALDARSDAERRDWLAEVADLDPHARVSGWLLSALRQPRASAPDLSAAPVQGGELLSVLCDLAAPIAVLIHHPQPQAPWVEAAIRTAAALVNYMPGHSVAVSAPGAVLSGVLRGSDSAALSMARQGLVAIASDAPVPAGRARSEAERTLHDALARDPRTAGAFALNVRISVGSREAVEVDLVAETARLAVEIDGWYHFREPQGYRRDRSKDVLLQRAGFFVMRFLAEDVQDRLALIVDDIANGLGARRAASRPIGDRP